MQRTTPEAAVAAVAAAAAPMTDEPEAEPLREAALVESAPLVLAVESPVLAAPASVELAAVLVAPLVAPLVGLLAAPPQVVRLAGVRHLRLAVPAREARPPLAVHQPAAGVVR